MTRGGRDEVKEDPERRCIVTGESQPKVGLVRFCLGPDGQVVADILNRLPGRGFYVTADRAAIEKAAKKAARKTSARKAKAAVVQVSARNLDKYLGVKQPSTDATLAVGRDAADANG